MKCKNCGLEVDCEKFHRCPRCNSVIKLPKKCGDCKGCSIYSK